MVGLIDDRHSCLRLILLSGSSRNTKQSFKVAVGDTLTVLDESNRQHKIRRVGTDARERKQPFSSLSRQNLWDMVFGKTDIVEWYKRNRYKHVLGKVLLDGRDINLEQIRAGLAWHYKQYGKAQPFVDRSTMRG